MSITYLTKGQSLAKLSTTARMATDDLLAKKGRSLAYVCFGGIEATARYVILNGQMAIKIEEKAI